MKLNFSVKIERQAKNAVDASSDGFKKDSMKREICDSQVGECEDYSLL